jgi:hypothetical protein
VILPSVAAQAGLITITNCSLESQTLGDGAFIGNMVTGWTLTAPAGVLSPISSQFSGGNVPDGQNSAFSNGGILGQSLDATLTASMTLALLGVLGAGVRTLPRRFCKL